MNSLTELNGFVSSFSLSYTDQRLPNVIFDRAAPVNQTQSVDKGFTISASIGIDIVEILNAGATQPVYTIDVSNLTGATVTWASLPDGVTVTNTTAGVYVVEGFQDKVTWDLIKSPTIDFSDDYYGAWTYTSSIAYTGYEDGAQTKTWTTAVTVNNILFWSNASQFIYELSAVTPITGVPQLGNLDATYPGATWTVVITPTSTTSINTFTTTGTGGTFSVNASTKVITISGTRTQVNSRINGLRIDANATAVDFVLTYVASNSVNATTDTVSQLLVSQGLSILGAVTEPTLYYVEDSGSFDLDGAPLITDVGYDGSGLYIYTITPSSIVGLTTVTVGGSGGTASVNNSTKVITLQGTRSQVNGRLTSITYGIVGDYEDTFNLQYNCVTPRADTADKIQVVAAGSNDTEVTNMNISRTFLTNNANTIFASSTPFISDLDASNPTYTVIFTCSNGQFSYPTSVSPYVESSIGSPMSITGTKTYINSLFSQIKFYPTRGFTNNTTFNYTQIKNGVTQVDQTVTLIAQAAAYANARSFLITSSQSWTPDPADIRYGTWDLALVGGGGSGGFSWASFARSFGGGGGGEILEINDFAMQQQTYNLVVGQGGVRTDAGGGSGNDGGNTIGFGYTARGGKKGIHLTSRTQDFTITGGSSGNGNIGGRARYTYPDGTYTQNTGLDIYQGGGGAGYVVRTLQTGLLATYSISGRRNSLYGYTSNQTFTNVSLQGGSGNGAKATVFIQNTGGATFDWNANCEVTITDAGSGYLPTDTLRVDVKSLFPNYPQTTDDIILSYLTFGDVPQKQGSKGKLIQWDNSANSMYGYYGGGGSGSDLWSTTPPGTGAIGNLVTFAAAGRTHTNGIVADNISDAPAGSGGGGSHIGSQRYASGGSGVIGIRIR